MEKYRKPFYASYRLKVISKLEKMGLHHLERNIDWEVEITPTELKEYLGSAGGSIYGIVPKNITTFPFTLSKPIRSIFYTLSVVLFRMVTISR